MDLFKRLLLTKFPHFGGAENMNPISMFIGFISAKEFFSIINRKVIENHKLNLFDINIDPIEFKMGFGNNPNSGQEKEVERYFSYCSAANLNGYLFYSPANISNALAILASLYFAERMQEEGETFFLHLLYTLYLFSFTVTARIKVFPFEGDQENFNRFVETFFQAYLVTLQQLEVKISDEKFLSIKKSLLQETDFFFLLYRSFFRLNTLLDHLGTDEDYLTWILGEATEAKRIAKVEVFKSFYQTTKSRSDFSPLEQEILMKVWPADILIKYLYSEMSPFLITQEVISKIYDKSALDSLVKSFVKSDAHLATLLDYLLDYKNFKSGFFDGLHAALSKYFSNQEELDDIIQDLDEMISAIDLDGDDLSQLQVPERIKQESKMTEKLLNFYVTFLGGLTTARGDSFYFRIFKNSLLKELCNTSSPDLLSIPEQMSYYSKMIYLYNKNLYYYHYIDQNIRAGKNKFSLPTQAKSLKIAPNFSTVKLYNQSLFTTFFQDINPRDTKLYIKNSRLLNLFKSAFGEKISQYLKLETPAFLASFYGKLIDFPFATGTLSSLLQQHFGAEELINMKNSLYSLDYWINREFADLFSPYLLNKKHFHPEYVFSIFAVLRETFLGMLLLLHHVEKSSKKKFEYSQDFWYFYFKEVITIDIAEYGFSFKQFQDFIDHYKPFLDLWIQLDDNKAFFSLIAKNIKKFLSKKGDKSFDELFSGDDHVWFRGLLKNITYYNKRYFIPQA